MQISIPVYQFKSFWTELQPALTWLTNLGIDYSKTRFGAYARSISPEANPPGIHDENSRLMHDAAIEASELDVIYKGLSHETSEPFIQKLKEALGGPIHSLDEIAHGGSSHKARSTAFELVIASHFAMGGFKVKFDSLADVVAVDDRTTLYIECKRPFGEHRIARCTAEAYRQLKRRYEAHSHSGNCRGIYVVSAAKLWNPEYATLLIRDEADLGEFITFCTRTFLEEKKGFWYKNLHDQTMAVAAYFQTALKMGDQPGGYITRLFGSMYLSQNHSTDLADQHPERLYFNNIANRLNSGQQSVFAGAPRPR